MSDDVYVVLSLEHGGMWWGWGASGYVRELSKAGHYTRAEALRICTHAIPGRPQELYEVPIRLADLEEMKAVHFAQHPFGPAALA